MNEKPIVERIIASQSAMIKELCDTLDKVNKDWAQQFERYGHKAPEWALMVRASLQKAKEFL